MDSGTLGAEKQQPIPKPRWTENSKVYTRKFRKGNNNNPPIPITTDNPSKENGNDCVVRGIIGKNNVTTNNSHLGNVTISVGINEEDTETENKKDEEINNDNDNDKDNKNDEEKNNDNDKDNKIATDNDDGRDNDSGNGPWKSSPLKVGSQPEVVNLLQLQQNLPLIETISVDSASSSDRAEYDGILGGNGYVRPVATHVNDRVSICVSAARSTEAVWNLKRKLEDELDQVRRMARRLEAKEVELNGYCSSEIGVGFNFVPYVEHLQLPVNGVVEKEFGFSRRAISDVGSVGFSDSRQFRHLSVGMIDSNHQGVSEFVEKGKTTPKANQYYRNSEFLLGKEKLLPIESNRKSKSSGGGRRYGRRDFDFGFETDKQLNKNCNNLLTELMKHKHGWVFNTPVDVAKLGLHDYFDIIKHPMDLGTVKYRMNTNWYKTPTEFAEDVRLTFHNALTYNPEGQDVHIMAQNLLRIFEDKWPSIEVEYDRKLRFETFSDFGVPTPTSKKTYAPPFLPKHVPVAPAQLHQPPPSQEVRHLERSQSMPYQPDSRPKPVFSMARAPALKKPKAKDLNKRDMTFEEKQKLSTNLQSLPSEKLDALVQIIKKRNSAFSQHDDEIEVDIDSVDAETLWELDRFVTNYKKSLSKHKRKAELALQARALATQAAQETIPTLASIKATKEARTDDGNIAPSQHVSLENHYVNVNGSSSSSSSSSDSGSSSSGSDSDSSSGSG